MATRLLGSARLAARRVHDCPWEDGTLKFLFSTGFRTPALTERYLEIANFLTANPDIKPERVYSAEIDLAHGFGSQNVQCRSSRATGIS